MDFDTFKETQWLINLWKPIPCNQAVLIDSPEEFYEEIYKKPYQDWCVEDHQKSTELEAEFKPEVTSLAEKSFLSAWEKYPNSEFCGLFCDDIETIASLLIIHHGNLRPFTAARMEWYLTGRFPCGYKGNFPNGVWLIV